MSCTCVIELPRKAQVKREMRYQQPQFVLCVEEGLERSNTLVSHRPSNINALADERTELLTGPNIWIMGGARGVGPTGRF